MIIIKKINVAFFSKFYYYYINEIKGEGQMKKKLTLLSVLLLLVAGCSNNETKEEKREITPIKNAEFKNLPDWILQPTYSKGIAAVGEAKIGAALDVDIDSLNSGDSVVMGMYFLADHNVINKLIKASNRGVDVKIIFDRSKDAFGMSTNGLPNKPVAKKLLNETKNKIQVKWYFTNGEQYHTKF